jgi:hypothetical protein
MTHWPGLPGQDDEVLVLRSFRRNAAQVRQAQAASDRPQGPLRIDTGFLEQGEALAGYQRLSGPIRRALLERDRAAFVRAFAALERGREVDRGTLTRIDVAWRDVQQELDATVTLGGTTVARRQVLLDWLDALTFHNTHEFKDSYGGFLDHWGKAGEGMAADLAGRVAGAVLTLDATAAEVLEEPLMLPSPPPAPPLPDDRGWWSWLSGLLGRRDGTR